MKTYEQINDRIESGKAVVLTADEIMDYVDKKGVAAAAKEVDVVTTATFGPMCSSGCFLNFGHSKPRIRMSEAWVEDVLVYAGVAAVDVYLGATQLRHARPGEHVLSGRVPLRRRPRHRGPRRRQDAPALCPLLRDGRVPAPRDPHVLHDPGPQPGDHGQPAELLPELQRGDQRFGPDDLHVPGHPGAPAQERDLLLRGPVVAAA